MHFYFINTFNYFINIKMLFNLTLFKVPGTFVCLFFIPRKYFIFIVNAVVDKILRVCDFLAWRQQLFHKMYLVSKHDIMKKKSTWFVFKFVKYSAEDLTHISQQPRDSLSCKTYRWFNNNRYYTITVLSGSVMPAFMLPVPPLIYN